MSSEEKEMLDKLIDGCKCNKQNSQRELYEIFSKQMMAICFRYTGDYESARDVMHDGFIKVFTSIKTYSGKGSFEGWMKKIFVNTALDYVRELNYDIVPYSDAEYKISNKEDNLNNIDVEYIYDAIKKLPYLSRIVFNMFNIDGYTIKEISQKLSITEGHVRTQHYRAKEKLKELLKNNL